MTFRTASSDFPYWGVGKSVWDEEERELKWRNKRLIMLMRRNWWEGHKSGRNVKLEARAVQCRGLRASNGKTWLYCTLNQKCHTQHCMMLVLLQGKQSQYSVKPLITVCESVRVCVFVHHMCPFVRVCVCSRVLICSDRMIPWHPGVIHIKSQLALKFGQTPKVFSSKM